MGTTRRDSFDAPRSRPRDGLATDGPGPITTNLTLLPDVPRERGLRVGETDLRHQSFGTSNLFREVGDDAMDVRRCLTTIGPSCNTDQGVRRTCECYGYRNRSAK